MKNNYLKGLSTFDTATLSDVLDGLGIEGGLLGIKPQIENSNLVGRAFTVEYRQPDELDKELKQPANFIDDIPRNYIPVLANNGNLYCTVWGDILTKVAQQKGIQGTVIDGCCRDINYIRTSKYNLFSKDVFMQSGKGRTVMSQVNVPVTISGVTILPGDYIRGDDNGIVIIPQKNIKEVIELSNNVIRKEKAIRQMVDEGSRLGKARDKVNYSHAWEVQN